MTKTKTTFIIGAGSNHQFGFPLGKEMLINTVHELNNTSSILYQLLLKIDDIVHFNESFVNFGRDLHLSGLDSIDEFVFQNPQYEDIARAVISFFIIKNERESDIFGYDAHWYKFLWDQVYTRDFKDFPKKDFGIITFNYDRSFENYLYSRIDKTYGYKNGFKDYDKRKIIFEKIPILHVYGKIDKLPYESTTDNNYDYGQPNIIFPFDNEIARNVNNLVEPVKKTMNNIALIMDDRQNNKDRLEKIIDLIRNSKKLIFLGFAFNQDNMERLSFIKTTHDTRLTPDRYGFWYGYNNLDPTERSKYEEAMEYGIKLNDVHYDSITDYLRNERVF